MAVTVRPSPASLLRRLNVLLAELMRTLPNAAMLSAEALGRRPTAKVAVASELPAELARRYWKVKNPAKLLSGVKTKLPSGFTLREPVVPKVTVSPPLWSVIVPPRDPPPNFVTAEV